jgi:iron complex transport system substrate-binding protein
MSGRARLTIVLSTLLALVLSFLLHGVGERLGERVRSFEGNSKNGNGSMDSPVPRRLVVFSPSAVEIIFALGAGDKVVGVTRFATFPPEAKKLPVLGGLSDIHYEQMTALRPDFIIAQNATERLESYAEERGIPIISLQIDTTSQVYEACRKLGRLLGMSMNGVKLAKKVRGSLEEVRKFVEGLERVDCFISVDRSSGPLRGVLSTGKDTFLTKMIDVAGGRNIFEDMQIKYPVISKETLLVRAPQVVLELKPGRVTPAQTEALIRDWQVLAGLPAVQNKRVYVIDHEDVLIPGPRMGEVAYQVAAALHSEIEERSWTDARDKAKGGGNGR